MIRKTRSMRLMVGVATLVIFLFALFLTNALAISPQADWTTFTTQHFVIHATKRADLKQIGQVAEGIYSEMAPRYNYNQGQKIDLYIYTDRAAFLSESPSEDAVGYASPSKDMIAILLGVGNSTITLGHEINHIIFIRSISRANTVPEWFIEGLAIHESQPGVEAADLEKYALVRDIPDLVGTPNLPKGAQATQQDYSQGYLKINFIIDKFGEDKLYEVIHKLQSGASFNKALVQSLGYNQDMLNAKWKSYARGQYISIWLMQLRDIGWYLLGALFLLAIIIAPLRRRKRLREMEDEESMVSGSLDSEPGE